MVWHEIFSTHKHIKMHHFVKNGVVLHHLAILFNNTNAVSRPEQGDQTVHGVLCQTIRQNWTFRVGGA